MKPYEFMRIYHPSLGRFVYKHKRSGFFVDNIFKSRKKITSATAKKIVKPIAKKALKSGTEHVGRKIGEKGGDLIMKKLSNPTSKPAPTPTPTPTPAIKQSTLTTASRIKPVQEE